MCALPPEDWLPHAVFHLAAGVSKTPPVGNHIHIYKGKTFNFHAAASAAGRLVSVTYNGITRIGQLQDTMPHKADIHNGAIIDLNPAFAREFDVEPPFMLADVTWKWADSPATAITEKIQLT